MASDTPRPTDGELAILTALWSLGPATVRQIHERLGRDTAYTTVLKLVQIMTEKRLVKRTDPQPPERAHIYSAVRTAQTTQRQLVRNLLDKAFAGSAGKLALQALATKRVTPAELAEIQKLISTYETRGDKK